MKKLIIIMAVAAAFLLTACDNLTSSKRFSEDVFVLRGVIYAGRAIDLEHPIFFGKTINAEGGNFEDLYTTDATVVLKDMTSGQSIDLLFGSLPPDSTTARPRAGYYDPNNSFIIQAGHTYQIVAKETGSPDSVWAQTTVPAPIHLMNTNGFISNPQAPFPRIKYDDVGSVYPMEFSAPNADLVRLYAEFYCFESWQNAKYNIDFGGEDHPEKESDYEDLITGAPRRSMMVFTYAPSVKPGGGYSFSEPSLQMLFTFYGRYRASMYSIDENFFKYNYKSEGYRHGGIHNGYGCFGSASGDTWYTQITE